MSFLARTYIPCEKTSANRATGKVRTLANAAK